MEETLFWVLCSRATRLTLAANNIWKYCPVPALFGIFNFFCLFLLSSKKNKRMISYSGKNECRWNRWSSSWEGNIPMLNAGRRKLVSDTQRYVLSTGEGVSSCRSQRYARLILQSSWSKVGLNTSPSEAGSRPKGANGQHAMQQYNSTQRSL